MEIKTVTDSFVKILLNPPRGWKENSFTSLKYNNILFPLLTGILSITFASRLIGKSLSFLSVSSIQHIMAYSILSLLVDFVFFVILVYAINSLLPFYDKSKDKTKVAVLVLCSLIPFYAALIILNLFPSLFFLGLISLYSFVILFWGIKKHLKIKPNKSNIFFIITALLLIGIYLILHFAIIYPFFEFVV
jgi:hypothetical protein